jgi:DNA mismatch repair protein MutL
MPICVLSEQVAAQIAAGEVIERPASVVKELVENALDAGATAISVEVTGGGRKLIRVADNGCGISADEVGLAFQRYATSKLVTTEDLDDLQTLGFRGEALASIASVGRVTLVTRAYGEELGTRMRLAGHELLGRETVGAPQGTLVAVENLFFNVPARLKFLKQEATERRHIAEMVTRYAMIYPEVRFSLTQDSKEMFCTTGSGEARDVLVEVFGVDTASQMVEIEPLLPDEWRADLPKIGVSGYVGLPAISRSNRNQLSLFVNRRWIQDSGLAYAVVQAYHTLLMVGRYPVAIVQIGLPPNEVDVNVHPTKAQVRFRHPEAVFSTVQRAVRRTVLAHAPPPSVSDDVLMWGSPEWAARRDRLTQVTSDRLEQLGLGVEPEDGGAYAHQRPAESSLPAQAVSRGGLPILRVVGQVGATYIVAEGPAGLYLIDQHAAHERVLYERFMAEQAGHAVVSQELLASVTVELSPEQADLLEDVLGILRDVGFVVESFGVRTYRLRAVPALVTSVDPVEALVAALGEIECGEMPTNATAEARVIARVCKRAAIKAGQTLSYDEMKSLVRQLERCESPRTCPHGRPTMLHLSAETLAKEFGRLGV